MDRDKVRALAKQGHVLRITALALAEGLDVSRADVERHYYRFREWYDAKISTGYLITVTGISKTKGKDA